MSLVCQFMLFWRMHFIEYSTERGLIMQHCCSFSPDDIYYLQDTYLYTSRRLAVGLCPVCSKPIAELIQEMFNGDTIRQAAVGIKANNMLYEHKEEILYSMKECNYQKFKSKPFGWKYGINKNGKSKGQNIVKQYACDFYGNKELVKTLS